jgi:membrane protease YdiL (CAAX protease family)
MYRISNGIVRMEPPQGKCRIGLGGFLLLAFGLSWLGVTPMVLNSWLDADSPAAWRSLAGTLAPLQLLMFFGALIAAVVATLANHGRSGLRELFRAVFRWRVGAGWYLLVLAVPGLIAIVASLSSRWIDPSLAPFSLQAPALLAVLQIFGVYLLLNTEEIAWRGYALPYLQARMRPLQANLLLALIWGLFHSPYFMMKGGHPGGYGLLPFALMVVAIGLVMGMTFNATRGSILVCHLLHQSLNAWSEGLRVFPVMNHGSQWPFRISVVGILCFGVVAALWLWNKGRRRGETVAPAVPGVAGCNGPA